MRKLLGLIFSRWVLAALGLLALSLLIWHGGEYLGLGSYHPLETPATRGVIIGLILALYVARLIWQAGRSRWLNSRLLDGLARPPAEKSAPEDPEVATLRTRFQEAIGMLKRMRRLDQQRRSPMGWLRSLTQGAYVYQLPWYVFIGAPGSGKTTALMNAGLRFPLAESLGQAKVQGVGGTRNCDWWFAEEAVLIDTAGRYTTQDSDRETDAAAWNGFLALLKKHRPRCPLNGVIVTVNAADLLTHSSTVRASDADAIRNRIKELQESFGITMPVYVLVTKADLMAGFAEFFADLSKEDRSQVWGFTVPEVAAEGTPPALAQFNMQFDALERRLHDRLIDRLQGERDSQRRALIYSFPQQFEALRESLRSLLETAFSKSRFADTANLRGVYFTSGTQEGSPLDRALGNMARAFGLEQRLLPAQRSSGRSYFLQRLLHDVIFIEAPLTGTNPRWERRRTLLRFGAASATALIAIGLIAAWTVSFVKNRHYVEGVRQSIEPVARQVAKIDNNPRAPMEAVLPVLDSVRTIAQASIDSPRSTPGSMGFGLSQVDKLEAAVDDTYTRLLRDAFLPRLGARLEEMLRSGALDTEKQYEALKAYIMLYEPKRMNANAFRTLVVEDWRDNLFKSLPASAWPAAEGHLDAMLEHHYLMPELRADSKLVDESRKRLSGQSLADRIYSRLKRQGVDKGLPDFNIAKAGGEASAVVFRRESGAPLTTGVPALFTRKGYEAFQDAAKGPGREFLDEEDWVLGTKAASIDPTSKAQIQQQVLRLYLEDYARIWLALVRDLRLRTRTLDESVELAGALSQPDTPLPKVMKAIVSEVTLGKRDEVDKVGAFLGKQAIDAGTKKLQSALGGKLPLGKSKGIADPEQIVDAKFDDLRRFVSATEGKGEAQIDLLGKQMSGVYFELSAIRKARRDNSPVLPDTNELQKLKTEADRAYPDPVRGAIADLYTQQQGNVLSLTRSALADSLRKIAEFCIQATKGRYPFEKSSEVDVRMEDFSNLFAPGGRFDAFIKAELVKEVDINARPWKFRRKAEGVGGESSEGLRQLQRAEQIRDTFFRGGGNAVSMRFEFTPKYLEGISEGFELDIDGQKVAYNFGPTRPIKIEWPGPGGTSQVRWIKPAGMGGKRVFDGPWALFRLFDANQVDANPARPEQIEVTFRDGARRAVFEVTASSVRNPFRMRELEQFQCPTQL